MQAEGTEDLKTEEGQAEAPGENQVKEQGTEGSVMVDLTEEVGESSSVLTQEELGKAQRYDATLANIREKAYKGGGPYFWKEDIDERAILCVREGANYGAKGNLK